MRSIYRDEILHFQPMNQDDGHLMLQHFDRFDHGLKMQFTTIYRGLHPCAYLAKSANGNLIKIHLVVQIDLCT
jgi:hypothetical protein